MYLIVVTLSIIAGKPGSGKTYHMMMLLVAMLVDWLRYEIKHWDEEKKEYIYGEEYPSSVWTNIVMNEEGLNETVSKCVGQDVDAWKYVHFCDDAFFDDMNCTYWWNKFPAKSVRES
jgi:broad-specificity NMP kinase